MKPKLWAWRYIYSDPLVMLCSSSVSSVTNCSCFVGFTFCYVSRAHMKWIAFHLTCPWWSRWETVFTCTSNLLGRMKPSMMISRRWRLIKTREHTLLLCQHSRSDYSIKGKLSFSVTDALSPESSLTLQSFCLDFPKWLASTDIRITERANKLNPLTCKEREVYACTPYKISSKFWFHHSRKL